MIIGNEINTFIYNVITFYNFLLPNLLSNKLIQILQKKKKEKN